MPIHVEVVSREEKLFEETEADVVLIPATEGQMGVYPRHAPTVTTLDYGEVVIRKGNAQERFLVFGGVVDVRPGKVVVLAELAESSFAIDIEEAEAARARAEKRLAEGLPPEEQREATLQLRRANLELKMSRKMKDSTSILRILDEDDQPED
jgi:F-type H+-transporting ATPase subunit epsilon